MPQANRSNNASEIINQSGVCNLQPVDVHSKVFPWIYLCLAFLGFLANGLVVYHSRAMRRKPTVIFALNMVASDVIQCFSLFFRMAYYLNADKWQAQDKLCGMTIFVSVTVFYINLYCNMWLLLWVSICRYAIVVRPNQRCLIPFRSAHTCRYICGTTWLVVVVLIGSHMVYREIKGVGIGKDCFDHMNNRRKMNSNSIFALGLVVFYPILITMLCTYSLLLYHLHIIHHSSIVSQNQGSGGGLRVRRKVVTSLLVFLGCFLPYHVQRSVMIVTQDPRDCAMMQKHFQVKTNTILVAAFNCVLNPILYLAFRTACCRARRHIPPGIGVSTTNTVNGSDTPV